MSSIAVIGDWQNAWVTAVCLAHIGHDVTLFSVKEKLEGLEEPGLDELVKQVTEAGRFRRIGHFEPTSQVYNIGWVARDVGVDGDMQAVGKSVGAAWRYCKDVVVSSQVPLGFCKTIEGTLGKISDGRLAYVPENMRLGFGIETFLHPDRVIVGTSSNSYGVEIKLNIIPLPTYGHAIITDLSTAEMIKHATNAFLATSISLVNELAEIGAAFKVDMSAVAAGLRADSRIGPKAYVRSGEGFAGGTLSRDLRALQQISDNTQIIDAVLAVNNQWPHQKAPSCQCIDCRS